MITLRPRSVRVRLTLWYVGVLAGILCVYIVAVCFFQYWQLTRQIYHDEVQDMETVEGLLYFAPDGNLRLHEEYHSRPQSRLLVDRLMEVHLPSGALLYRNDRLSGMALGGPIQTGEGDRSYDQRHFTLANGTRVLMISHIHPVTGTQVLIRIGYNLGPAESRMIQFLLLLLFAVPLALVVAGFAGYRIAGEALAPLGKMATQAEHITAKNLQERLPIENAEDELGHMARVLNHLLGRLEQSFVQLQRFTSDAAHELRTPLASIRSVGEVGLQQSRSGEEYRGIIESMLEETASLTQMIDGLLLMAKAESGQIAIRASVFPLANLISEVIALLDVVADERNVRIRQEEMADAPITVLADRALLRLAIVNVLHNAIKFSPPGTTVIVSHGIMQQEGRSYARITVQDSGPGIPHAEKLLVFDRFYRSDISRASETEGIGLGLSVAKWAVEANGGRIHFDPSKTDGAICFIDLPFETRSA